MVKCFVYSVKSKPGNLVYFANFLLNFSLFRRSNIPTPATSATAQHIPLIKKRKLEPTIEIDTLNNRLGSPNTYEAKMSESYGDDTETQTKRRRKANTDDKKETTKIQSSLPQKKRSLAPQTSQAGNSPVRKVTKSNSNANSNTDEPDDETLIRETEAALKSLSGSWPGPRGSAFQKNSDQDESPSFENLFEEKKTKMSPSVTSTTSSSGSNEACSLKDVITLRDQNSDHRGSKLRSQRFKSERNSPSGDVLKMDECDTKRIKRERDDKAETPSSSSRYDPPDFNELVDDSSNELEIDMSDPSGDKEECDTENRHKRREPITPQKPSLYSPYNHKPTPNTTSPFSTTSAFRPPTSDSLSKSRIPITQISGAPIPPGPYPAEATFIGYPPPPGVPMTEIHHPLTEIKHHPQPIKPVEKLHPENKASVTSSVSVASPGATSSKQYTILQPAGLGSRAASAIQDVTREGVLSVSAVSAASPIITVTASNVGSSMILTESSASQQKMSSSSSIQPNFDLNRPPPSLSPGSIGKGKFFNNSVDFVLIATLTRCFA